MKYFIPNYIEEHEMKDGTLNVVNRLNGAEITVDLDTLEVYRDLRVIY